MSETQTSYDWINKIIQSCTTDFHLDGCAVLIELYMAKYEDEALTQDLKNIQQAKYMELHNILN